MAPDHTIEMAHSTPTAKSLRADAFKCAAKNSQESIDCLCQYWTDEPGAEIDCRGNTLLHILVMCENEAALKEVIILVTLQDLLKQNMRGETALHEAARLGQYEMVKTLVQRNVELTHSVTRNNVKFEAVEDELVVIRNKMGETPLYVAAASGEKKVLLKLLDMKSDCYTQREDGSTILHAAIMGEYYSMAFDIYGRYPELAHKADNRGNTPLNLLAISPTSFRSGSMYGFEYLGRKPFIPLQMLVIILYYCIPHLYHFPRTGDLKIINRSRILQRILKFAWFKPVDDTKQKHILAEELGKKLIAHEADWSYYSYAESMDENSQIIGKKKNEVSDPFIQAIENSIPELVYEIITKYPDAANCIDEKGRNILHIAAEKKSTVIYEILIKNAVNRKRMLAEVDFEGNTILHQTTNIAPTSDYISLGIFYFMCWNAYWYQKIRRDCSPHMRHLPNKKGETAEELYINNTSTHRKEAGKVMNDINGNLMVVATLIGAVSFSALFTVPGGYHQDHGYPLNLESDRKGVERFLGYDAATLYAGTFALGMLLSIQLSRFNVEDFYISLPLKYLIAISALYYAACYCGVTVLQASILEEVWQSWILVLVSFISVTLGLGYVDAVHYAFSYIVEIFWFSLRYTSQQR